MGIFMEQLFSLPKMSPGDMPLRKQKKKKKTHHFPDFHLYLPQRKTWFSTVPKGFHLTWAKNILSSDSRGSLVVTFDHVPRKKESLGLRLL